MMVPEHGDGWNWPRFFFHFLLLTFTFCAVGTLFALLVVPQAPGAAGPGGATAERADAPPAAPCHWTEAQLLAGLDCIAGATRDVCVVCLTNRRCFRFNPYECPELRP